MALSRSWSYVLGSLGVGVLAACGSTYGGETFTPPGQNGSDAGPPVIIGGGGGDGGGTETSPYDNSKTYTDFGAAPVADTRAESTPPAGAAQAFASTPTSTVSASAPLCVFEPEAKVRYPRNWVAPRVRFRVADADSNVVEVRVKAGNQSNDLVFVSALSVVSGEGTWLMSNEVWELLRTHSYDKSLSFTVRTARFDGGTTLSKVSAPYVIDTGILPVSAEGSIVYFSVGVDGGTLRGFSAGTENHPSPNASSYGVLRGQDLGQRPGKANCVGCHSDTPDDNFVLVSSKYEGEGTPAEGDWYGSSVARVNAKDGSNFGATPSAFTLSPLANAEMARGVGGTAASKALWDSGKRLIVGWFGEKHGAFSASRKLKTVDLVSGQVNEIPTTGSNPGVLPAWSADGRSIYYGTTNFAADARVGGGPGDPADIMSIPFDPSTAAATALPQRLAGASDTQAQEFYPAVSYDSAWLAFNRIAFSGATPPDVGANPVHPDSTIELVPASGGARHTLEANQAIMCPSGTSVSVGQANRWPKWAPGPKIANGNKFYFVVFSSLRRSAHAQLYVAPVMVSSTGEITSYGALYVRAQDANSSNHTPVWSGAKIESNVNVP